MRRTIPPLSTHMSTTRYRGYGSSDSIKFSRPWRSLRKWADASGDKNQEVAWARAEGILAPVGEESRKYRNADTGWEIAVTRGGISESRTHSGTGENELLNALPSILENAFLHRQEPDKQGRKHINGFHRLFAPVVLNNRVYLADVTLRESADGRLEFYLLRAGGELTNLIGRNEKVIPKKGAVPHTGARSTPSRQILTAQKAGRGPHLKASAIMPAVNPVIAGHGRTMLPLARLSCRRGRWTAP